jgi:hypothetical protein
MLALGTRPALAQESESRQAQQAAERAEKAGQLHSYEPNTLERRLEMVDRALSSDRPVYLVELSAAESGHPSWERPVRAYFRRLEKNWRLVGFERILETDQSN